MADPYIRRSSVQPGHGHLLRLGHRKRPPAAKAGALTRIRSPALVVAGTRDGFFPEPLIRETARRIPGATLCLLKDAGHGAFVEQERLFDRIVEEFLLGRVDKAPPPKQCMDGDLLSFRG